MNLFKKHLPLTNDEMATIASAIAVAEKTTSGEIRVSIRHRRTWSERRFSLHEMALREFFRLGMDKTKEKTGVLLYFLTTERAFHIIADEGIHTKVADGYWDTLASTLSGHFKNQKFSQGICDAVQEIGQTLTREFPVSPDDTNELSNDIVLT
ncbi:MAG: TPM domain-containing protein [Ignavibacteriales bacterium]|nr:TPM domain-containing protein [Ignavibacteriales bacterium]